MPRTWISSSTIDPRGKAAWVLASSCALDQSDDAVNFVGKHARFNEPGCITDFADIVSDVLRRQSRPIHPSGESDKVPRNSSTDCAEDLAADRAFLVR